MSDPAGGDRVRLPLRWRVAVAFALTATVVTGLLALVTWNLASNYMTDQLAQGAVAQFSANARLVGSYLRRHPADQDLHQALLELEYDQDDTIALGGGGHWASDGAPAAPAELDALAHTLLTDDQTAPRLMIVNHRPVMASVLPVPDRGISYIELSAMSDLEQSLRFLRTVLLAGVCVGFVLCFGLGRWAGRRALRPLAELTATAQRVAGGDLDARLPAHGDADLAGLADTFNRTTEALAQRVARDARFAADVSHELRSPLTTMINAAAVLNRRHDELSPTARHALRLLTDDLERFHRMVVDLLEISRERSTDHSELEPCDLAQLVSHAMTARHEQAELVVEGPRPVVLADRRRLDRVVANLLDNATRHAGGAVRILVRGGRDRARLEIDDAGPGVPGQLREQVFERFTRGERPGERRHDTGSGLGLALVAQHVQRHTGRVWVEDSPEGGARFVVELPLVPHG